MILGMSVATFALIHTVLSLVGIVTGLVVAGALVTGTRLDRWAAVFLVTTVLAYASGFGFPFVKLIASHVVGAISLVVLVVQLFKRIPNLFLLAPTQSEPPFALTQLLVMALFVWLGVVAVKGFRPRLVA